MFTLPGQNVFEVYLWLFQLLLDYTIWYRLSCRPLALISTGNDISKYTIPFFSSGMVHSETLCPSDLSIRRKKRDIAFWAKETETGLENLNQHFQKGTACVSRKKINLFKSNFLKLSPFLKRDQPQEIPRTREPFKDNPKILQFYTSLGGWERKGILVMNTFC